jgi:hypothetical protein
MHDSRFDNGPLAEGDTQPAHNKQLQRAASIASA